MPTDDDDSQGKPKRRDRQVEDLLIALYELVEKELGDLTEGASGESIKGEHARVLYKHLMRTRLRGTRQRELFEREQGGTG